MQQEDILFHKAYVSSQCQEFLQDALTVGNSLFKGKYSSLCEQHILKMYPSTAVAFTSSCTEALSLASLLLNLTAGDEVIVPSYTFPSVANAFLNRGIQVKLADSLPHHPNLSVTHAHTLLTPKTKAIVFMCYGGQADGIEEVVAFARGAGIYLIEDAAHSFDSSYRGKLVGTFGDVSTFSFHESKSVSCGQGGMLLINNPMLFSNLKSIVAHGTNKWALDEGLVSEYNWTSLGAEFNLSELNSAALYSQFKAVDLIKAERKAIWYQYYNQLSQLSEDQLQLPIVCFPDSNFYIFYLICNNRAERNHLIAYLKDNHISAVFHYTGLHNSEYYLEHFEYAHLCEADNFSECLVRLPIYPNLSSEEVERVCKHIIEFYAER